MNATKSLRKIGDIPVTITLEGLSIRDKVGLANCTGTKDFSYNHLINFYPIQVQIDCVFNVLVCLLLI